MSQPNFLPEPSERLAERAFNSWGMKDVTFWDQKTTQRPQTSRRNDGLNIVELLPERGANPVIGFHKAACLGDQAGMMRIVQSEGYQVLNELDFNGCTPLMYAVLGDSKSGIECLMNLSARKETVDEYGRTAVHYAAVFGHLKALQLLIDYACNWCPIDQFGRTPLHWSIIPTSTKCLDFLLRHRKIVLGTLDPEDKECMTPVHCAAQYCRPKHLELLERAGADFTSVDIEGMTALHWTASNPDDSALTFILNVYPPLLNQKDFSGATTLHHAAGKGSSHIIEALLEIVGIEDACTDDIGRTPLHWACISGSGAAVATLLKHGAVDSVLDSQGYSPLHLAIQSGNLDSVCALLDQPAAAHLPDQDGRTPLIWAATLGSESIIQKLLLHTSVKKDINLNDSDGRTALHYACQTSTNEAVNMLLVGGADPNARDRESQTPLFQAVVIGESHYIEALVSFGGDPDVFDMNGNCPIHSLIAAGISSSKNYKQEDQQVFLAKLSEVVLSLGLTGTNMDIADGSGNAALHTATIAKLDVLVQSLLKANANPNVQDANGFTCMHIASMEGQDAIVELLLSHHAQTSLTESSAQKYTALDLAQLYRNDKCIELLETVGALSKEKIQHFAATFIQTAYRGYRARKLYRRLLHERNAVTTIAAYWKGYQQRKVFSVMLTQYRTARKIQSLVRGHLARKRYQGILRNNMKQRERERLMKEFCVNVLDANIPSHSHSSADKVLVEMNSRMQDSQKEYKMAKLEQNLRLELALKLRTLCNLSIQQWNHFRNEERQRRLDKASQLEANWLAKILHDSQQRHYFITDKTMHTTLLRTQQKAAITIQRAYKDWKKKLQSKRMQTEEYIHLKSQKENWAARQIQIAWRSHCRHRDFLARYYRLIPTAPAVLPKRTNENTLFEMAPFMRNTLSRGQSKHKLNVIVDSNIRIVHKSRRPWTQAPSSKVPLYKDRRKEQRETVESGQDQRKPLYLALQSTSRQRTFPVKGTKHSAKQLGNKECLPAISQGFMPGRKHHRTKSEPATHIKLPLIV